MKTIFKTIDELIDEGDECPLPLDVIADRMGIELKTIEMISWQVQNDGQLVNLTLHFLPTNN